jgi:hypothetical protein
LSFLEKKKHKTRFDKKIMFGTNWKYFFSNSEQLFGLANVKKSQKKIYFFLWKNRWMTPFWFFQIFTFSKPVL